MEHAVMCPQCNAPLTPHKFARSIVCSYCGATVRIDEAPVAAAKFHEAYQAWNSPTNYQISSWISLGDTHWALKESLGQGDISNVYRGQRARWPTELVVVKLLRDRQDLALFEREWENLQKLQGSQAPGADSFTSLLPQPVLHGNVDQGPCAGGRASIFRWKSGFRHTFEKVIQVYPDGIPPRASIWVWRRILEILSFIHASNMIHGAVLPSHLLVQENEHGIRLVGYSCSGQKGDKVPFIPSKYQSYYPNEGRREVLLTEQLDLSMSARCIAALLGGDPVTLSLPAEVPAPLAQVIKRIALMKLTGESNEKPWTIREELGTIAGDVYGPPAFIPIVMPG